MSSEEHTSDNTEVNNTDDSSNHGDGEEKSNGDQVSGPDLALLKAAQEESPAPNVPAVEFDPFAASSDEPEEQQAKPSEDVEAAAEETDPVAEASSEEQKPEESAQAEAAPENSEEQPAAEEAPAAAVEVPARELHPDMRWYVVNAYSSYELKAKRALEERIRQHDLEELFGEVHVPQETVVELVRGEKKTSNRKFFPGYMLVQMVLNQDTWHLVKETPKISGFVGDASEPVPLSEDEVGRILQQVEDGAASPRARVSFEQGDTVKVIDGPFTDFNGTIEEVKPEKGKVKVLISIFGRATPVELDFIQVEKS